MELYCQGETEVRRENVDPVPLCPPQIPKRLALDWNQVSLETE